jgi:hypothetical protein
MNKIKQKLNLFKNLVTGIIFEDHIDIVDTFSEQWFSLLMCSKQWNFFRSLQNLRPFGGLQNSCILTLQYMLQVFGPLSIQYCYESQDT